MNTIIQQKIKEFESFFCNQEKGDWVRLKGIRFLEVDDWLQTSFNELLGDHTEQLKERVEALPHTSTRVPAEIRKDDILAILSEDK